MSAYFSRTEKLGLFDILDWGCTFKLIINFFNLCWNEDCIGPNRLWSLDQHQRKTDLLSSNLTNYSQGIKKGRESISEKEGGGCLWQTLGLLSR